ncbi:hypothetical protein [Mucilaginibacter flavidus]|uniref:hypothetical protein n=1 Tax=Mucilaginibacter flavidus TaxID=2949309 RepID=UPI002092E891|nr:hypothetical protein [Mucilaginibacter flavidus]MCO5948067.1 hypothetical protein [Mucilaginibacter flavidus]
MKKPILLSLFILASLIYSCKKGGVNPKETSPTISGSYKGSVNVSLNGTAMATLYDHIITISSGSNSSALILNTNLIQSGAATVSGNTLTIARHTVNSNSSFYTVEYGTGKFNNGTFTFDFHQDIIVSSTNAVGGSGEWTGTMTKE